MNFALIMFTTIIFLQHFWENNIKRYCHSTDLKNKGGSLCLYGGLHVINLNAHVYFQSFAWHLQLRSPPPPPASSPLSKDRALHVSLTKYQWTLLIHFREKQYLVTDFAGKL